MLATLPLVVTVALSQAPGRVVVGTHEVPPFVIKDAGGTWSGISIDLWKKVAEREHLDYEIRDLPVQTLITGSDPAVDVTVSLNISAEREAIFDLTHAFFSTGLAIAVARAEGPSWQALAGKLWSPGLLLLLLAAAGLMLLSAAVMWLLERRKNPDEFGGGKGFLSGVMWSVETVVGYNDPQHRTRLGRAFGIGWAALGVLFISALTAQISSQLTVSAIESSIHGPDDLPRVRVGTVKLSAAAKFCERRGLKCRDFADATAAVTALAAGELDAVVYEAPILQYVANTKFEGAVQVLPGTFDNHGYAFGLKEGSPLREGLNRALLEVVASDAWRGILTRYLGAVP